MLLRNKTITVLGVTLTCLVLLLYGISSTILLDGFRQVESNEAKKAVGRMGSALLVEMNQLSITNKDYAWWDDTYEFIQDGNSDYIDTNLVDDTYVNIDVELMVFVNLSGGIVFSKGYNIQTGNEIPIPQSFLSSLVTGNPLLQQPLDNSGVSGFVALPDGQLMVASHSILDSNKIGPVQGTLIFGHYMDEDDIEHLSNVTGLAVSLHRCDDPKLPSDVKEVLPSLTNRSSLIIKTLDEQNIAGYVLYKDIFGKNIFVLKVTEHRDIYQKGYSTMIYFFLAVVLIFIVVGIILMLVMERFVLTRLRRLSTHIDRYGSEGERDGPSGFEGEDEFAALVTALNTKLDSIKIDPVRENNIGHVSSTENDALTCIPELQPGKVYFVDEPKADRGLLLFKHLLMGEHEGLCISRIAPQKIREKTGLEKTPVVWLSTTTIPNEKTIEPSAIARIHSTVSDFLKAAKSPLVLLEGLEYLIFVNNFRVIMTFQHSIFEKIVSSQGIYLLILSKATMDPKEWSLLTKDMEELVLTKPKNHGQH